MAAVSSSDWRYAFKLALRGQVGGLVLVQQGGLAVLALLFVAVPLHAQQRAFVYLLLQLFVQRSRHMAVYGIRRLLLLLHLVLQVGYGGVVLLQLFLQLAACSAEFRCIGKGRVRLGGPHHHHAG